jgi:hypothetical protein
MSLNSMTRNKVININFEEPLNQIRPKLYKYLKNVAAKIDGRSYQRFLNSFAHTKNIKLLKEKYESLKQQIDEPNQQKKITDKLINDKKIAKINKAADKIHSKLNNTVIVKSRVVERSDKFKFTKVESVVQFIGKKFKNDSIVSNAEFRHILTKLYYAAIKHIDTTQKFKFYTYVGIYRKDTKQPHYVYIESMDFKSFSSAYIQWIKEADKQVSKALGFYNDVVKLTADFYFTKIASGAGHHATESRVKEDIYKKTSVLQIKNKDKSCFWHSLAVLLSDDRDKTDDLSKKRFKALKEGNLKRTNTAKELCHKCCMAWDTEVSIDEIPVVEAFLKCNIYVLDIDNLPILGATMSLYTSDSLLYKSKYVENYTQCWMLHDENHYNVITNIKGFLKQDYFCCKCLSCFNTNKDSFDNHKCNVGDDVDITDNINRPKLDNKFAKDSAHYLKRDICKGSKPVSYTHLRAHET